MQKVMDDFARRREALDRLDAEIDGRAEGRRDAGRRRAAAAGEHRGYNEIPGIAESRRVGGRRG
jgi:hypothetical protein